MEEFSESRKEKWKISSHSSNHAFTFFSKFPGHLKCLNGWFENLGGSIFFPVGEKGRRLNFISYFIAKQHRTQPQFRTQRSGILLWREAIYQQQSVSILSLYRYPLKREKDCQGPVGPQCKEHSLVLWKIILGRTLTILRISSVILVLNLTYNLPRQKWVKGEALFPFYSQYSAKYLEHSWQTIRIW